MSSSITNVSVAAVVVAAAAAGGHANFIMGAVAVAGTGTGGTKSVRSITSSSCASESLEKTSIQQA
jgi:hypothetical protein